MELAPRASRLLAVLAALALGAVAMPMAAQAAFPGENGRIAFAVAGDVWTMNPDGSGRVRLTSGPATDTAPAWSADGRRIAFSRDGDIWTMDAAGRSQERLTGDPHHETDPAWSPDGARIAFGRADANQVDEGVWAIGSGGGSEVRLTSASLHAREPAWSPDGTRIAIQAFSGIAVIDADGTDFAFAFDNARAPDWSPDGEFLVFEDTEAFGFPTVLTIGVARANGSERRTLTVAHPTFDDRHPVWSPDGSDIAYVQAHEQVDIAIFADGGGPQPVPGPGIEETPSWQPRPSSCAADLTGSGEPGPVSAIVHQLDDALGGVSPEVGRLLHELNCELIVPAGL